MIQIVTLPDLVNNSQANFIEEMRKQIPEFNGYLFEFMKLWKEGRPTSADELLFIQEYCFSFEDYLEHLEVAVDMIQSGFEKDGIDRGDARSSALSSDLGEMMKKYKRVYEKLPKKFKPGSSTKTLKRILAEATEKLAKQI